MSGYVDLNRPLRAGWAMVLTTIIILAGFFLV
jgi:hypothetical protein